MPINNKLKLVTELIFNDYLEKYRSIEMMCLSTSDGFPVHSASVAAINFEMDTMAAASSTLFSVSDAVSRQILEKSFRITFIESEGGNVAFVALKVEGYDFVMAMSAGEEMNIGQLRVFINRVTNEIMEAM